MRLDFYKGVKIIMIKLVLSIVVLWFIVNGVTVVYTILLQKQHCNRFSFIIKFIDYNLKSSHNVSAVT